MGSRVSDSDRLLLIDRRFYNTRRRRYPSELARRSRSRGCFPSWEKFNLPVCFSRQLLPAAARNYAEELLTAKFFPSRSHGSRRDDPNGSSFQRRPFPFPVSLCGIHDLPVFTQIIRYGFLSRKLKSDSSLRKSEPKGNVFEIQY